MCDQKRLMPSKDEPGSIYDLEEVLDIQPRGDFAFTGWSYETEPQETYVCLKCGGDRFVVGCSKDALLTILKCPTCGWERCIHDG